MTRGIRGLGPSTNQTPGDELLLNR